MDKSTLKIIQDSLDDTAFILGLNLDDCNNFTAGTPYFNNDSEQEEYIKVFYIAYAQFCLFKGEQ